MSKTEDDPSMAKIRAALGTVQGLLPKDQTATAAAPVPSLEEYRSELTNLQASLARSATDNSAANARRKAPKQASAALFDGLDSGWVLFRIADCAATPRSKQEAEGTLSTMERSYRDLLTGQITQQSVDETLKAWPDFSDLDWNSTEGDMNALARFKEARAAFLKSAHKCLDADSVWSKEPASGGSASGSGL